MKLSVMISVCPTCSMRVIALADGSCPSCQSHIPNTTIESQHELAAPAISGETPSIETPKRLAFDAEPTLSIDAGTLPGEVPEDVQAHEADSLEDPSADLVEISAHIPSDPPGAEVREDVLADLGRRIQSVPKRPTACENIFSVLAACSMLAFVQATVTIVSGHFLYAMGIEDPLFIQFTASLLSVLVVGLLILKATHDGDYLRVIAVRPLNGFHALVTALLVLPNIIIVDYVTGRIFGGPDPPNVSSIDLSRLDNLYANLAMQPWPLAILVGCILPAVSEEIFFRGLIGRGLIRAYGVVAGVLITSLLFGLFHLAPERIVATSILGIVFHLVYLSTKSIFAPMMLHSLNNCLALVASRYEQLGWFVPTQGDGLEYLPLPLLVSSFVLVLILLAVLRATSTRWIIVPPDHWTAGFVSAEVPPASVHYKALRPACGLGLSIACVASLMIFAVFLGLTSVRWAALTYANHAMESADAGDLEVAARLSQQAINLGPNLAWPHSCHAWVRFKSNAPDEALAACDKALELDSTLSSAYVTRALALIDLRRFDEALSDCNRSLQIRPGVLQTYVARASAWLGKELPEKAIEDATAALKIKPTESAALNCRGRAYVDLKRFNLAIDDFAKIIKSNPKDDYALTWRAVARWETKDVVGTIADATSALEANARNVTALYPRALAFEHQQQYEQALADISKCIDIEKDNSEFIYFRCKVLLKMDKPQEALAQLEPLVASIPEAWHYRLVVADAYRQTGDLQRAESEEKIARKAQVEELVALGWQDIVASKFKDALARVDLALAQFPDHSNLYLVQAVARTNLQQYPGAIDAYTKALELDPDNAAVFQERGNMHLQNSAPELALTDLDRSIQLDPNNSEAYYCRALVHQALGNTAKGEVDLRTARELQERASHARAHP